MSVEKVVKVGCFSGMWGDTPTAAFQLVKRANGLNYLVADFLAEVTMGLLARRRDSGPSGGMGSGGFIKEFITICWKPLMKDIIKKKIKIVTNAGGLNPLGLKEAIEQVSKEAGIVVPKVSAIVGDDIQPKFIQLLQEGHMQEFDLEGEKEVIPKEQKPLSSNAYIGAFPIAKALDEGAEIVITGRCVDSALILGPLIHEFGWMVNQYDLLAAGSIAGHIIECGCQATGGNFTDWELIVDSPNGGWYNMGFPIVECFSNGEFIVTKPEGTGGLVNRQTVTEQLLYEIGDTTNYYLPDVIVDLSRIHLEEVGQDRVLVRRVIGKKPTDFLKVSSTFPQGYGFTVTLLIPGINARLKALKVAEAILTRVRYLFDMRSLPDFTRTNVETIGAEYLYGPHSKTQESREVVLRLSVEHTSADALRLFGAEVAPSALSMAPGMSGVGSGRPHPAPIIQHVSTLVNKNAVPLQISIADKTFDYQPPEYPTYSPTHSIANYSSVKQPVQCGDAGCIRIVKYQNRAEKLIPIILYQICHGRSGDKGDSANIAIIARDPLFYSFISQTVTTQKVKEYFQHLVEGQVFRFEAPGLWAFNFVLTKCLGGGGLASLRVDRQAKTYAQILLTLPLEVPASWAPILKKIPFSDAKL